MKGKAHLWRVLVGNRQRYYVLTKNDTWEEAARKAGGLSVEDFGDEQEVNAIECLGTVQLP